MPRPPSARNTGRIDLSARDINLPGVLEMGSYHYKTAQRELREVAHAGCFGICHLMRGVQTYRVGAEICHLRGGDQLLTFPGDVLDTAGTPEEKGHLFWLVLRMQPLDAPLLFLEQEAALELRTILLALPHRHFTAHPDATDLAATILNIAQSRPTQMQERLAAAQLVMRYLFQMLEAVGKDEANRPSSRIQRCLDHIAAHLDEPLAVPDLAALIGLSESRFKNRFRNEVGAPPGDYVLRSKIKSAGTALAQPKSTVTAVAHAHGFSSSQYFATVFRRFTGITPTAYREKHLPH
ncbi:MAG: AraC family transcriptional regulator [Cephaloticoccus sp.]|nr:AraC family transcriptional regulator [Cephaloticoccus sp.]MCF7760446.1 AraC family transcriptional regulator [Cephaloticoccus sp.]